MAHPRVESLIERLVERKVAVDPTLVVFRNWMLLRDLPEVYENPDVAAMPQRLQQTWNESSRSFGTDAGEPASATENIPQATGTHRPSLPVRRLACSLAPMLP